MGLDMYLYRRTYVGGHWDHLKTKGGVDITVGEGEHQQHIKMDAKDVAEIITQVAYWRKANAIHKWFVDNCQDGEDKCQESYVSAEQIKELIESCKKVLRVLEDGTNTEEVENILPTTSGFFFGSTDYDQWYIDGIKSTIEQLEEALKVEGHFYYSASW